MEWTDGLKTSALTKDGMTVFKITKLTTLFPPFPRNHDLILDDN